MQLAPTRAFLPQLAAGALLVGAVWLAFGGILDNGFIYDDLDLVETNSGAIGAGRALLEFFQPMWAQDNSVRTAVTGYWRPVGVLAIGLGRSLSGGDAFGPHAMSLLLHVLTTLAVWRLAARLVGRQAPAVAAALLFALHPVQVQSVAWSSAISHPLFSLFLVLAWRSLLQLRHRSQARFPIAASVWFGLSLLSKEQAVIFLPLAIWIDLHLVAAGTLKLNKAIHAWLTFGAVLFLYMLARMLVFESFGAGLRGLKTDFELTGMRPFTLRLELAGEYLKLLLWPVGLRFFEPMHPELPVGDQRLWWSGALVLAWIALLVGAALRRNWLCVTLALVCVLPQSLVVLRPETVGGWPLQDRYLYFSVVGFTIGLSLVLFRWARGPRSNLVAYLAVASIASGYLLICRERITTYANNEAFFRAAVSESPEVPRSWIGLGEILVLKYRETERIEPLQEALLCYLECLALGQDLGGDPGADRSAKVHGNTSRQARLVFLQSRIPEDFFADPLDDPSVLLSELELLIANLGRGWCLFYLQGSSAQPDLSGVERIFRGATRARPEESATWIALGAVLGAQGRFEESEVASREALELDPENVEALANLGRVAYYRTDFATARDALGAAVRLRPEHLEYRMLLIQASIDGGELQAAERELIEFERDFGALPEVHFLRGMLAAVDGELTAALSSFDRAIAADPDHGLAHLQRGRVLTILGNHAEARKSLERAVTLMPHNGEAQALLQTLLQDVRGAAR